MNDLISIVVSVVSLAIFLFAIVGLPIFLIVRHKRINKKKQEVFNRLKPAEQQKERQKRDAEIINSVTVILPLAIFATLQKQGVSIVISVLISLTVATAFRLIVGWRSK